MSSSCRVLAALPLLTAVTSAANATFYPKINLTDTSGELVQAHGGAILQSASSNDDNWYWFGEDKTGETSSGTFIGVNCYSSSDLSTWDHVGHVLSPQNGTNISSSRIVERPKVIYNDVNAEYVMWFHADNSSYGAAEVGVATSKTVDGQYDFRDTYKPFGNDSRDMTVWKDPDTGAAYLIYATNNNADFSIASLDADYYYPNETLYTFPDVYWEAPGVFKIDGVYYLLFSRQDGWTPTDNFYMTANSMSGPWSENTLLAPQNTYAYLTQNAYDVVINGSDDTTYLYYGDHWSGNQLASSTYAFMPAIHEDSTLSLHNTGAWTLDLETGAWADLPYDSVAAAGSTTANETLVACEDGCAGGRAANMTSDSTFSFKWSGGGGAKILGIQYVYNGPKNSFRHIQVEVNGIAADGNALLETTRNTTVTQEAPFPVTLANGDNVALRLLDYDGNTFLVDGVKVYQDLRAGVSS